MEELLTHPQGSFQKVETSPSPGLTEVPGAKHSSPICSPVFFCRLSLPPSLIFCFPDSSISARTIQGREGRKGRIVAGGGWRVGAPPSPVIRFPLPPRHPRQVLAQSVSCAPIASCCPQSRMASSEHSFPHGRHTSVAVESRWAS